MKIFNKIKFFSHNPHMIEVNRNYNRKKNSSKKLLQAAVVGCGGGGLMHLSHYLWHKGAQVKTAFDIDENRFKDIKSRYPFAYNDIKCTTNFEDILNDKTIDIISIATPDHTHAFYALKAIKAGKHVLCEKPMCTSIDDGQKIISESKKSNQIFAVFQQMRFVPRNIVIKSLIEKGQLGEIYYIHTGYIHDMRVRAFEFSNWRKDPVNFQHPLFGGIHHIDILRWLAGDVDEVYTIATHKGFSKLPIDDTYLMELKLKNGGIGSITTCFSPRVPKEYHPMRIYGTKGAVHGEKIFLERNGKLTERKLKNSEYKGVPQFRAQISAFIDAVNGKGNKIVLPDDAQKTVETCYAAVESWKTGIPVKVNN